VPLTIELPDELAGKIAATGEDPGRFTLAAVAEALARRGVLDIEGEPSWVSDLAAEAPHAGDALRRMVGILGEDGMTDAEALAALRETTRDATAAGPQR
jgi:hypothetical protein